MCIIANLIVIDQFTFRSTHHIYILTHWHSDHYNGIMQSWDYGSIYSSEITKKLMMTKYPRLMDKVNIIPYGSWHTIEINEEIVRLMTIDSNHMAGSIMVMINYRQKYYLHTGDMRFNKKIVQNCPQLFEKIDEVNYKCRFKVSQLHLDNTFCDPIFQFPPRSKALKLLTDLIKQHKPSRLFLCTDTVGKEQAFVLLGRYYKVKVAVNYKRMGYIQQIFQDPWLFFTLKPLETWIQVISKAEKQSKIGSCAGSIGVTLTGWTNLNESYPDGYRSYLVPYSLHSNFREMELLVSWVRPKKLIPIVREGSHKWESFSQKISNLKGYIFNLCNVKQRGLQFLKNEYCEQTQ